MHTEDFYIKLKNTLDETTRFPTNYLFKFIVPTSEQNSKELETVFNHTGAVIETKLSKNGNYTAYSIKVDMQNSDEIISKYKEAAKITGIFSI